MKDAKLFSFRFVSVPSIKTDDSSTGWKSDDTDTRACAAADQAAAQHLPVPLS